MGVIVGERKFGQKNGIMDVTDSSGIPLIRIP
jgi:hypothetical protein